jgi:hypothetical protein
MQGLIMLPMLNAINSGPKPAHDTGKHIRQHAISDPCKPSTVGVHPCELEKHAPVVPIHYWGNQPFILKRLEICDVLKSGLKGKEIANTFSESCDLFSDFSSKCIPALLFA